MTPAQFGALAEVPPELEWLANITNAKTRRAYKNDVAEFFALAGLKDSAELRTVTRAHVIAWRKDVERRGLADTSIRRKLSALSSLFDYLCEHNTVAGNPVAASSARYLLATKAARQRSATPKPASCSTHLPKMRSRASAIALSSRPCSITAYAARSFADCGSRISRTARTSSTSASRGKRDKIRFAPSHAAAQRLIEEYLALAGHGEDAAGPLFRPVRNNRTVEKLDRPLDPASVYRTEGNIVRHYGLAGGLNAEVLGLCVHSLRAMAVANALDHQADIAKVQEMARPFERFHDAALRPAQDAARGQPDISCQVLG